MLLHLEIFYFRSWRTYFIFFFSPFPDPQILRPTNTVESCKKKKILSLYLVFCSYSLFHELLKNLFIPLSAIHSDVLSHQASISIAPWKLFSVKLLLPAPCFPNQVECLQLILEQWLLGHQYCPPFTRWHYALPPCSPSLTAPSLSPASAPLLVSYMPVIHCLPSFPVTVHTLPGKIKILSWLELPSKSLIFTLENRVSYLLLPTAYCT